METTPSPLRISLWWTCLAFFATLLSPFSAYSQCDTEVSGVFTYCNAIGTPGTTGYFVAFRVLDLTGDTLNVVDLDGNNVTNRGKRVNDINTDNEPATVTITPLMISGVGADTLEYWYFGPYDNDSTFNIALVDPNNVCDTIYIASGSYDCMDNSGISDPGACDNDVPLYFLDFSQTEFDYGGGGGGNENFDEIFLIMPRTRESVCCDLQPANQSCFEFIIRLADQDIGLAIDDVGSGSPGGEIYADTLNMFTCTGSSPTTWPFTQSGGQSQDLPLCLLGGGGQEFVVLSCKSGGNVTGASIDAISNIFAPPVVTTEPCNAFLEVFNADTVIWSSPDDPNLDNLVSCTGDSTFCTFLYDAVVFGDITECLGDTFTYIVGSMPGGNECFDADTILFDTTYVVVFPVFTVDIDSMCNVTGDSLVLTANVSSAAIGCDYAYTWSTGDTTQSITVPFSMTEYFVSVTRGDVSPELQECSIAVDSIVAAGGIVISCVNIGDTLYACINELPAADTTLVIITGCFNPEILIYAVDESNGGSGCIGDTLIITRYYIVDLDGDTITTTTDRDTCTQLLSFVDNIPPVIISGCPSDTTVTCASEVPLAASAQFNATDNCGGHVAVTHTGDVVSNQTCANRLTITRTYEASDDCGNTATCSQTITVFDNIPPSITCPANVTVQCASQVPMANINAVIASDNCGGTVAIVHEGDVITSMSCANRFTITRTYSATDSCGNTATCAQIIEVFDNTPPMITCPANVTINCTDGTLPAITGTATATDNCNGMSTTDFTDSGLNGACPATFVRTWTATDVCGNTAQCSQLITIDDTIPPSITCPSDVTILCTESTDPANTGTATASDNCTATPVVMPSDITFTGPCPQEYFISRTWTATDICGNTATCFQNIVVIDTMPPDITCPPNITVQCATDVPAPNTNDVIASDSCGVVIVGFIQDETVNFICVNRYTINRTYQASDLCGNSASCIQIITVNDTTPPTLTCPPDVTVQCGNNVPPPDNGLPAMDNCGLAIVGLLSEVVTDSTCENRYTITRTYQASDLCGNTATCAQIITVNDDTPPMILCPPNITVTCSNNVPPPSTMLPADDNCGLAIVGLLSEVVTDSTCINGYTITRTYQATDLCGNTATCAHIIVVDDNIPPMIICPDNITVNSGSDTSAAITGMPVATDNCGGTPTPSFMDAILEGECESDYTIFRFWSVTDECGNSAFCTQIIEVAGLCNVDLALVKDLDAGQGAVSGGDNVNFTITITNEGLVTVSSVTVIDYIPDGFILNDPDWTGGTEGSTGQSATIVLSSANGGLDPDGLQPSESVMVQITLQAEPDIMAGIYENIAEINMVIDSLGNDVTNSDVDSTPDSNDENDLPAEDDHDPALICVLPNPIIIGDPFVCSGDTATYQVLVFNPENLYEWIISGGGIIIENNDSSIVVVWTGAPGGPFVITVNETSIPECSATSSLTVVIQGGEAIACLDHVNLSIDNECGTIVTSGMILTGDETGNNNYTVYVIDMNGDTVPNATLTWMHVGMTFKVSVVSECNGQSCWGWLTVEDKLPPAINCVCPTGNESDTCTISCLQIDEFLAGEIPFNLQPTVVDNCGGSGIELVDVNLDFETCSGGSILVTWLATDVAGNTATCEQEFTIIPLTLETLVFPADFFGNCDDSSNPDSTGWPQVDGLDLSNVPGHCNILATYTDNEFDLCGGGRKIIRTWTVFDWCVPETRQFTQFIILADQEGPVLTCPADMTVGTDVWYCYSNILVPKPTVVDACSGIKSFHLFTPEGTVVPVGNNFKINELPLGTHTVTWTVYDDCHNSSSCSFDITVIDNVPPVMACQAHLVVSLTNDRPNGITLVPADAFDDGSFDNCSAVTFRARRMDSCIDINWTTNGACVDDVPGGIPPINQFDYGTVHGICVPFACCDVGSGPIMVELEVSDNAGNVNYCMVEVIVQDKLAPEITCPPDITVSCEFEFDVVEGLFSDESGNNDGTLDEDPLSEIFGNMFDAFRHDPGERGDIIINDPANDQITQPFNWGIEGWATDNCEVNMSVSVTLYNDCSGQSLPGNAPPGAVRLITRRFVAFDDSGNPSPGTCIQRIWVVDFDPFYISDETCNNADPFDGVMWPCDVLLNTCPDEISDTGEPQIFDDHCNIIGISFEDSRFDFADGSCYKILREWTVIDWCQFDVNTGAGIWSYTQTIKVLDSAGPDLLECPQGPVELCLNDPGVTLPANNQVFLGENNPGASSCSVHVTMSQSVREFCSASVLYDVKLYPFNGNEFIQLKPPTVLQLDANHEGDMSFNTQQSSMQSISEDGLPYNSPFCGDYHRLVWTVEDGCGNVSICDHLLRLVDCKKPTPVCLNGISTMIMPGSGEVTIWASDFNASSYDDCTPGNELLYSFSGTAYEPSFTYTCDNVPEFGVPLEEEIWVADAGSDQNCNGIIEWNERNVDVCVTYIIITDENNVCDQEGVVLIGEIMTEHTDAISQATVKLSGPGGTLPEVITSTDGKFTFANVTPENDYSIKPERNDDHRNGVSTLDLVRIQKHLLGKELFTSPYQYIAADANASGSVSAVDLIEIRKLILGLNSQYPLNQSWRFVKAGSAMEPNHPWPFEETIEINNLTGSEINNLDFVGVKVGDVNNTAKANAAQILPRSGGRVLNVNAGTKEELNEGALIEIRFLVPEMIRGFQWTLETHGLEFVAVKSKDIFIDDSNVGQPEKGIITMSWNGDVVNKEVTNRLSFVMLFKVTEPGRIDEMLQMTNIVTPAEAYTLTDEILDVNLVFDEAGLAHDFALYQNQPNPWNGNTFIGFDLPEVAAATLTIYDVAGKVLRTISGQYRQGYNTIMLSAKELHGPGILYYRLESGGHSATKKMIIQ